jgi:prolyl-tRNA synthetase
MKMDKSQRVREAIEQLYADLLACGIEVLLNDCSVRPGFMFADMKLTGIPHRILACDKFRDESEVEYRGRKGETDNVKHQPTQKTERR